MHNISSHRQFLNFHRLFALAAVLLVLCAAPGWAGTTKSVTTYQELTGALADKNCDTIIVTGNISVDAALNVTRSVTIKAAEGVHPTLTYTGKDTNAVDRSVIKCDKNDVDLTLEGLTIKDGQGCKSNANTYGGGLYASGGVNVEVTNCVFTGNTAEIGGGMYVRGGRAVVTNCAFTGSTADSGGGMRVDESIDSSVTNCTFTQNTAETGGGLYVSGSMAVVTNCTFTGNTAAHKGDGGGGGGINIEGSASADIINCTFAGNTAAFGAEVRCDSTLNAVNTIFWNSGEDQYIYNHTNGTVKLYNCAYKDGAVYGKKVDDIENFKKLSWAARISRDVEVEGVTHTVFPLTSEDTDLIDKGRTSLSEIVEETVAAIVEPELAYDQLGELGAPYENDYGHIEFYATRDASPDIGAIEYIEVSVATDKGLPDGTEGMAYPETTLKPAVKIKTAIKETEANPERSELTITGLPDGLKYSVSEDKSIKITGTPTEAGTFDVVITATCGVYSANETLRLSVTATKVTVSPTGGVKSPSGVLGQDIPGTEFVTFSARPETLAYTWSVSPDVKTAGVTAAIDKNGKLTFSGAPEEARDYKYTVTAKTKSGTLGTAAVTLSVTDTQVLVTGVELNRTTLSLDAGKSETLTATVNPDNATYKGVSWSSSDESVATVDGNGTVTGKKAGTATITAVSVDGPKATCSVTVQSGAAPDPKPEPEPEPQPEPKPKPEPKPDPTPESHDIPLGDKTVPYLTLEKEEPSEEVEKRLSELIGDLPPGTPFNKGEVTASKTNGLNTFIESINEEEKEAAREITAVLTPVEVSESGVYFMKVAASEDQKEKLKGGYDLQYHVKPYSADAEVDVKTARLADTGTSDDSHGILVNASGEKLSSSAYNGEDDLYVLVYFAQAKTPYAQYLTMEAESKHSDVPTSDKDSGGGCSAGLESLALLTLLFLIYRFCTPLY